MAQDILQRLNQYYPNRPGLSQLEMLALAGIQTTPLRQAAGIPGLMLSGSIFDFGDGSIGRGGAPNPSPAPPPDISRSPFIDQFPPISSDFPGAAGGVARGRPIPQN